MYEIDVTKFGMRLIVKGEWSSSLQKVIDDNDIQVIELNYAKGWKRSNVEFLCKVPNLKGLILLDWKIDNIEAIHCLNSLKWLEIRTHCKTRIDFSAFPELQECFLQWRPGCESIFECRTLRNLILDGYRKPESDRFGQLTNIESLTMSSSRTESLIGLRSLLSLQELRLYSLRHLYSLDGIQALDSVLKLDIKSCRKIQELFPIENLHKLQWLGFSDCGEIESIAPACGLSELRQLYFSGTTSITDGDLNCILRLPKLEDVSFANRRHYSLKRAEVEAEIRKLRGF